MKERVLAALVVLGVIGLGVGLSVSAASAESIGLGVVADSTGQYPTFTWGADSDLTGDYELLYADATATGDLAGVDTPGVCSVLNSVGGFAYDGTATNATVGPLAVGHDYWFCLRDQEAGGEVDQSVREYGAEPTTTTTVEGGTGSVTTTTVPASTTTVPATTTTTVPVTAGGCSFWDPGCWLQDLFVPSDSQWSAFQSSYSGSSLSSWGSGFVGLGSGLTGAISSLYSSADGNGCEDYVGQGEQNPWYSPNENGSNGAITSFGSPCFYVVSATTAISGSGSSLSWIKDILTFIFVILCLLGCLKLVIRAMQSGK